MSLVTVILTSSPKATTASQRLGSPTTTTTTTTATATATGPSSSVPTNSPSARNTLPTSAASVPTSLGSTLIEETTSKRILQQTKDIQMEFAAEVAETIECDSGSSGGRRSYNFHGQCLTCPSTVLSTVYPFLLFLVVAAIIVLLQNLVSMKMNLVVWVGIEFLQMLYLFGISSPSISWPNISNVIFSKFLPLFAMDVNAAVSLQCILGWSPGPDFVWFLSLPPLIWIAMTIAAKASKERIILDRTIPRWIALFLYLGQTKLVLTSLEAIKCDSDSPSSWIGCTGKIYASVAGIVGLAVYGLVFPLWFLRAMKRHAENESHIEATRQHKKKKEEKNDIEKNGTQESNESGIDMDQKGLDVFLVMGIFPRFRSGTWWWPGVWIIRKSLLSVVVILFPESPILLLVTYLVVLFVTEILQRCTLPLEILADEGDIFEQAWAHPSKVDTGFQVSLLAFCGLGFLLVSETKSRMDESQHTIASDTLLLVVLVSSLLYWFASVGVSARSKCERFSTRSLLVDAFISQNNSKSIDIGPGVNGSNFSVSSNSISSVSGNEKPPSLAGSIPKNLSMLPGSGDRSSGGSKFSPAGKDKTLESLNEDSLMEWQKSRDTASSVSTGLRSTSMSRSQHHYGDRHDDDYSVYDETIDDENGEISTRSSSFYRDGSIATIRSTEEGEDDEDMATLVEEIFIDERTGLPIDANRGQWALVDVPINE